MRTSFFLGISGGSGAGKSTLGARIRAEFEPGSVCGLSFDDWYHDASHLPLDARRCLNFDAPESLDREGFVGALRTLSAGEPARLPVYDFEGHCRSRQWRVVPPAALVLVDGILLLHWEEVRSLLDETVFLQVDDDERLRRRLVRDRIERGRTEENIRRQWAETVLPMHHRHVEPSRQFATTILHEDQDWGAWVRDGLDRWTGSP